MRIPCLVQTTICILLLPTLGATQSPGTDSSDRSMDIAATVLSLERSKFDAQQHRDTGILNAVFDEGLMWVSQDGELSGKANYLESLHNSATNQLRMIPETLGVKVFGASRS